MIIKFTTQLSYQISILFDVSSLRQNFHSSSNLAEPIIAWDSFAVHPKHESIGFLWFVILKFIVLSP